MVANNRSRYFKDPELRERVRQAPGPGEAARLGRRLLGSTCDCPEADGFACVAGTCTWNYL